MSVGTLGVDQGPLFEDSITHFEFHTHTSFASTLYGKNDEIPIPVQQQDVFTLPSESYLYIEDKLSKKSDAAGDLNIKLVNNTMAVLFKEIHYEVAGIEVDRTKNVGITTTVKNLLTVNGRDVKMLSNAGWLQPPQQTMEVTGDVYICLPLKIYFDSPKNTRAY